MGEFFGWMIAFAILSGFLACLSLVFWVDRNRLRKKFCGEKELSCFNILADRFRLLGGSIECSYYSEMYRGTEIKDVKIIRGNYVTVLVVECEKWFSKTKSGLEWKEIDIIPGQRLKYVIKHPADIVLGIIYHAPRTLIPQNRHRHTGDEGDCEEHCGQHQHPIDCQPGSQSR